eukprot:5396358-Alexandrium_andersonii.AAC.1
MKSCPNLSCRAPEMAAGAWKDVFGALWQQALGNVMMALTQVDANMRDSILKDWQCGRAHLD